MMNKSGSAAVDAVVIGAGKRAEGAVFPLLHGRDDVNLKAVVEVNEERLDHIANAFDIPHRFRSLEQFLASDVACDAAFLATPPWVHHEPFVKLVEAEYHVYCEKPLAYSYKEAETMVRAAANSDRVLMIGFDRRFAPATELLLDLSENVSKPLFVHVSKSKPGNRERQRMLIENAVHAIDLMGVLLPTDWTEIKGFGTSFDSEGLCEKQVGAVIRFADGAMGTFHQVREGGGNIERLEAYGVGWSALVQGKELKLHCSDYTPKAIADGRFQPVSGAKNTFVQRSKDSVSEASAGAFLHAVRNGLPSPVSPQSAMRTQKLCDAILRSAGLPGL